MEMAGKMVATIRIKIEQKDAGFYVSSEDIAGLWLWGRDLDQIIEDIVPTIIELFQLNQGLSVNVKARRERLPQHLGAEKIPDHFDVFERLENQNSHIHD